MRVPAATPDRCHRSKLDSKELLVNNENESCQHGK